MKTLRLLPIFALAGLSACAGVPETPSQRPNTAAVTAPTAPPAASACVPVGQWVSGSGKPLNSKPLNSKPWLAALAQRPAVLLGETHTDAEHHRWQLQTLAALHAYNPRLAIGMESFPRRLQPVLDRWVAGDLSEEEFLKQAEWGKVWNYDVNLYWPLMHFARMNRLPLVALNVDRTLVSRVSREGWAAIPPDARQGVGDPAPPSDAYRARLKTVMASHSDKPPADAAVERFIAAQVLWDRAMAEAIAAAHRETGRTVVAIVGSGHVRYREGIAHQLADLKLPKAAAVLPWSADDDCGDLTGGKVADGLFGIAAPPQNR